MVNKQALVLRSKIIVNMYKSILMVLLLYINQSIDEIVSGRQKDGHYQCINPSCLCNSTKNARWFEHITVDNDNLQMRTVFYQFISTITMNLTTLRRLTNQFIVSITCIKLCIIQVIAKMQLRTYSDKTLPAVCRMSHCCHEERFESLHGDLCI